MSFRILYQDAHFVAIDKPAGFHVHPPEDARHTIHPLTNCLYVLRKQIDAYLYPVHRLDRATSGVLVFALSPESARAISGMFREGRIKKTYYCVTRGWTDERGVIDHDLSSETGPLKTVTEYQRVGTVELPHAVGRYPTARYSLVRVEPQTGRMHQIRRHMDSIAHPLIGDTVYGNGEHNRFFRTQLQIEGLLLKAYSLEFSHPVTGVPTRIVSRWNGLWHRVFDLFGVCPY